MEIDHSVWQKNIVPKTRELNPYAWSKEGLTKELIDDEGWDPSLVKQFRSNALWDGPRIAPIESLTNV